MHSLKEHFETIVVGGGPKGLMLQREAEEAGLDCQLLEAAECGRTWNEDHMNKKMPVTPSNLELSNLPNAGFQDYLRSLSPTQLRRNPLLEGHLPTVGHLRDYLRRTRAKVSNVVLGALLTDIHPERDGFLLKTSKGFRHARNVVLATGLVGYGKTEFHRDPTQLLGKTELVQHQPVSLRHEKDMGKWLKGVRRVAVIGSGPAAYSSLVSFKNLGIKSEVHLIEDGNIEKKLSGREGAPNAEYSSLAERFLPSILEAGLNLTYHNHTQVCGANKFNDSVRLRLAGSAFTELEVDRVLLCTGFAYDFTRLPFAKNLLAQGVKIQNGFPVINSHHQLVGEEGPMNIYMLGAGASHLGHKQITLSSTPEAIQSILGSIQMEAWGSSRSVQKSSLPVSTF